MVTAELTKEATTAGPYEIPENLTGKLTLVPTIIDRLAEEVSSYPTDKCATTIASFQIVGGGVVLNVGETFEFKVKVDNNGQLNMRGVTVQVIGTSYADVASSSGSFDKSVTSAKFDLNAGGTHTSETFRGKAKATTGTPQDIVTARISSWDANLDHILIRRSRAGAAEGKLHKDIKLN